MRDKEHVALARLIGRTGKVTLTTSRIETRRLCVRITDHHPARPHRRFWEKPAKATDHVRGFDRLHVGAVRCDAKRRALALGLSEQVTYADGCLEDAAPRPLANHLGEPCALNGEAAGTEAVGVKRLRARVAHRRKLRLVADEDELTDMQLTDILQQVGQQAAAPELVELVARGYV